MTARQYELFADYHQIVFNDDSDPQWPEMVTDADCIRRIHTAPRVAVMHTARNMTVPVSVEVLAAEPAGLPDDADHVTDCSLDLPSGRLVVSGLTHYMADPPLLLPPGLYRMRAIHRGLGTLSADGLEGDDRYEVVLWLASEIEPRVLKQWAEPSGG